MKNSFFQENLLPISWYINKRIINEHIKKLYDYFNEEYIPIKHEAYAYSAKILYTFPNLFEDI